MKYLTKNELQKLKEENVNSFNHFKLRPPIHIPNYSNKRKKQQRAVNQAVRLVNKNLENDWLWRSRFFIRQVGSPYFIPFGDKSGAQLFITLRCYDKKQMLYVDYYGEANQLCSGGTISWVINDAIIDKFKAWKEDCQNDLIDYKSITNEYTVQNATKSGGYSY